MIGRRYAGQPSSYAGRPSPNEPDPEIASGRKKGTTTWTAGQGTNRRFRTFIKTIATSAPGGRRAY